MDFKLCYISNGCAWFTSLPLDVQWGDDWNDAPYEHNAGDPYDVVTVDGGQELTAQLLKLMYSGPLHTPEQKFNGNSVYSVQDINNKQTPWLASEEWAANKVAIFAGCGVKEFITQVQRAGGEIYAQLEQQSEHANTENERMLPAEHRKHFSNGGLVRKLQRLRLELQAEMDAAALAGEYKVSFDRMLFEARELVEELRAAGYCVGMDNVRGVNKAVISWDQPKNGSAEVSSPPCEEPSR